MYRSLCIKQNWRKEKERGLTHQSATTRGHCRAENWPWRLHYSIRMRITSEMIVQGLGFKAHSFLPPQEFRCPYPSETRNGTRNRPATTKNSYHIPNKAHSLTTTKKRLSRPSFCQKFARDIRNRTTTKILGGYDHWSQFTNPNFLPQIGNAIVTQTISPQAFHQNNATLPQPSNIHAPVHILTYRELKKERKKCSNPCLGSSTTSIAPFVKFL